MVQLQFGSILWPPCHQSTKRCHLHNNHEKESAILYGQEISIFPSQVSSLGRKCQHKNSSNPQTVYQTWILLVAFKQTLNQRFVLFFCSLKCPCLLCLPLAQHNGLLPELLMPALGCDRAVAEGRRTWRMQTHIYSAHLFKDANRHSVIERSRCLQIYLSSQNWRDPSDSEDDARYAFLGPATGRFIWN